MGLASWGRFVNRKGVGLEPGERVQAALLCAPQGSVSRMMVGQALGGLLDMVFDQDGPIGRGSSVGGSLGSGVSGGVSTGVEGIMEARSGRQDRAARDVLQLPAGDLILAITPRRFLVYSAYRGLLGTKIALVGPLPLNAVANASVTSRFAAPQLTVTFEGGSTMTFDVGRGQEQPDRFVETLRHFQRR
jgi:hypothetical protein